MVFIYGIIGICIILYISFYFILIRPIKSQEKEMIEIFYQKVSKIPALIEVMRPHVLEERAFDLITTLHSEVMIREYKGIYHLLEHNARIHDQFLFLLKLSVHIPDLQKDPYFLYIRDFIISYDRNMQAYIAGFNRAIRNWNKFVFIKNITLVGIMFPGRQLSQI